MTSSLNLPAPGRSQWLYGDSSSWQPPVFLLNSRLGRFSAAGFSSRAHVPLTYCRHPLSRSYGVMLPSSFSTDHSSTLGFSPRLPVSVYGTVRRATPIRGFSWRPAPLPLAEQVLRSASSLMFKKADLPTSPHYSVASGRPSPDGIFASASPLMVRRTMTGTRILTRFPSSTALALDLGAG